MKEKLILSNHLGLSFYIEKIIEKWNCYKYCLNDYAN